MVAALLEHEERDYLTKFYLRASLDPFLKKLIYDTALREGTFTIVILDLDHFKKFNDKFGHPFGDEILKYTSSTLRLSFPKGLCHFFRYGGDEFILILPDVTPKEAFHSVSHFTYIMSHRPFLFKNRFFKITVSCGIAGFPQDGQTIEQLINKADEAMYYSKRRGRNLTTLASKMMQLKFIHTFVITFGTLAVIILSYLAYQYTFKDFVHSMINRISNIRVITESQNQDTIRLENKAILRGDIIKETNTQLILQMHLSNGDVTLSLDKSEIESIKYGPKSLARKKYLQYIHDQPDSHIE